MAQFSERIGVTKRPEQLELKSMSTALRVSLWNLLVTKFEGHWRSALKLIYYHLLKKPIDDVRYTDSGCQEQFRKEFELCEWHIAYDIVEFIAQNFHNIIPYQDNSESIRFDRTLNFLLGREFSGYRMVGGELAPITNAEEVSSIETALGSPTRFGGAKEHIRKALSLLGKKPDPDYENSIKESISAVESICKVLSASESGGIEKALSELEKKAYIHPAMKSAFCKLYGYTSDEEGIRHAILEGQNVGFAEAQFMLVTCSAFINFVIEKSR